MVEGGEEQGINGEREGREGKGNLAAGKTSAQRRSVGSLSSTCEYPKAKYSHI